MNHKLFNTGLFLSISILMMMANCEFDTPSDIYPVTGAPDPVITRVEPDSAVNGITEIKIVGQNFSPQREKNFVYFGITEGVITNATANELTIARPLTVSGTLILKVVVRDAFQVSEFGPYKMELGLVQLASVGKRATSIAVDNTENLYADIDKDIYKITPLGELSLLGTIDFISSEMRIGAAGDLFIQKRDNRDLYRIAKTGGVAEQFSRIKKRVSTFDFDENGYIYSGGDKYGLFVTSPDGLTSNPIEGYENFYKINAVRVYNGFLYIAADTLTNDPAYSSSRIYKLQLLGDGSLGPKIVVFDWANAGSHSPSLINDITFSQDGDLFVATDHPNPILIIHPDGSTETLYEGLLASPLTKICWGNGNYLYINWAGRTDEESGIYRIIMGKKGAPYYGRP